MAARIPFLGKHARRLYFPSLSTRSPHIKQCLRHIRISSCLQDTTQIKMPALSPTMTEGTIVKWLKQEGDSVAAGDVLCEIQTDKAVVSFDTEEEGILAKIIKPENTNNVALGTTIALMVGEGEDWQNVSVPAAEEVTQSSPAPSQPASQPASPPVSQPTASQGHSTSAGYGPAVNTLLAMYPVKASDVTGTGPHGRLLKGDLLQYIKANNLKASPPPAVAAPAAPVAPAAKAPAPAAKTPSPASPSPPAKAPPAKAPQLSVDLPDSEDIPLTNMRSIIARRLTESKTTIPHSYASIECQMDNVVKLRKKLMADGVKVSVNDFIIKAVAVALQRVPEVNAIWTGEGGRRLGDIDICVAVATDNGLITPIVKDAIGLGVQEISEAVRELAGRARQNRLKPEEFQGGSFTISNLGMFGISEFTAVINPPQACILAVGGSRTVLDLEARPVTRMTVQLSADGRIVDEFLASRFLQVLREVLEEPMLMLSQGPRVVVDPENPGAMPSLASLFAK